MQTAEEIIKQMCDEMPFHLAEAIKPYIIESMKIYARQACEEQKKNILASMRNVPDVWGHYEAKNTNIIELK